MIKIYGLALLMFITGFAYAEHPPESEWVYEEIPEMPVIIKPCEELKRDSDLAEKYLVKWFLVQENYTILMNVLKNLQHDKNYFSLTEATQLMIEEFFNMIVGEAEVAYYYYMLHVDESKKLNLQKKIKDAYIACVEKILIDEEKKKKEKKEKTK